MKKLITVCAVCLACTLTTAWGFAALPQITINIDENGNGTINGNTLQWGFSPSIYEGLFYVIPNTFTVEGDLVLTESGTSNISDLLKFRNDQGTSWPTRIYALSDNSDGADALADIGIYDSQYFQNPLYLEEQGSENGWNGIIYTPLPNQPGYINGQTTTYYFTSDVPEPATICLMVLGSFIFVGRKNKKIKIE